MLSTIRKALNFRNDETGAVTVDWVALTAGVLIIGAIIGTTVMGGADDVGDVIAAELTQLSTNANLTGLSEAVSAAATDPAE